MQIIGDKLKITQKYYSHTFKIGEVVGILSADNKEEKYWCTNGKKECWVDAEECTVAWEVAV